MTSFRNNLRNFSAKLPNVIVRIVKNYWPALVITIVIFAFLSNLFFPKLSFFVTPDYGRSDSWSLSIADSFYYANELKHNNLPIWNPHIGNGFPVFAEGQTGELYPLNLVIFRLLPFALAYNLTLVLTLIISALGTYLFCRSMSLSKLSSTFAGLIFSLGGFFVFHLQHHALIEAASLFPWVFWTTNEFIKTRKATSLLLISVVVALQLLTGFPQLAFYTQVALLSYVLMLLFFEKKKKIKLKTVIFVFTTLALGFLLAAVQLIPTYEFLKLSTRTSNPQEILSQFPYTYKNLLQFLNPFILGSPKDGTYPLWQPGKWGIFWESSAFVGIIPLVLGLGAVFGNIFKTRKSKNVLYLSALLLFAIMLALGEKSPLYVVFTIPPFSLFRVPSRFLLVVQFTLAVLSAVYLNNLKRKLFSFLLVLISVLSIFIVLKNYNPTLEADQLLRDPQAAKYLKKMSPGNIYSAGTVNKWNQTFVSKGWDNMDSFFFFENYLDQNSNLIFGINQFSAYESLQTRRQAYLKSQIANNIKFGNGSYLFSDKSIKLLAASNVTHIVTPFKIVSPLIEKVFNQDEKGDEVNIYKIKNPAGILFLSGNFTEVETIPDITNAITSDDFDPLNSPLIEGLAEEKTAESYNSKIQVISQSETNLVAKTNLDYPQILTFNQSIYPGWEAYIDNQKAQIIPSNINSMAIEIPKGSHAIIFKYFPRTLVLGVLISLASILITLLALLKFRNLKVFY